MANEFAPLKARRFFWKLARGPQLVHMTRRANLFTAAGADVVVAGHFSRRFDEMKARLQ
jgi:hypothetical protein